MTAYYPIIATSLICLTLLYCALRHVTKARHRCIWCGAGITTQQANVCAACIAETQAIMTRDRLLKRAETISTSASYIHQVLSANIGDLSNVYEELHDLREAVTSALIMTAELIREEAVWTVPR